MLPTDQPVAVGEILSAYVELAIPATRSQIEVLAQATRCPPEKEGLLALIADSESYLSKVLNKRVSLLDLLERYRACELPLAKYLAMLPVLKPRQYSISSSPLWNANHCTLTVAVVEAPALSGQGTYYGVASNYLKNSKPGTRVAVTIRPSQAAFHPPESLDVPIIMACAGTGVAPFHGFLQDRALRVAAAGGFEVAKPAPAVLFFGCDHPDVDYLYRSELEEWEKQGLVRMRPAFTFAPEDGVMFVQHRIWKEREEIIELVTQGAIFFVCGDGQRMAPAVHETCRNIYVEATQKSTEEADAWMEEMERGKSRYVADVFA